MATPSNVENVSNRLKKLEDIEKKIMMAMKTAGLTLEELSKDKPVDKNVDKYANGFVQNLEDIDTELTKQIAYLSQVATTHQHEGSSYANQKKVQLLTDAFAHVTKRVNAMLSTFEKTQPLQPFPKQ